MYLFTRKNPKISFVRCCFLLYKRNFHASFQRKQIPNVKNDKTDIKDIRNIGIMAHIDAGKTTTTERFLFYAGHTKQIGDVDDGNTVTDFMDQERERGITITAAAVTFFWGKHKINLIDTPGHVDFTLEVERSLRVLDGAVAVLDASAGVEAQTLTVWRQADRYKVPRLIYLNKMDKAGADFHESLDSIREKLNIQPLVIQLPIGEHKSFQGMIDVITLRKMLWDPADKDGTTYSCIPIEKEKEPSLYEEAYTAKMDLINRLADFDDDIGDHILNDGSYSDIAPANIMAALRKATIFHKQVPVLCGSSFKNKGVQPLLNSTVNLLPNPTEREHQFVEYYKDSLCGLAFKIVPDRRQGQLTFVRLYSGDIKAGNPVYNINRDLRETTERLFEVYADQYKIVHQATAGNIVAIKGLNQTVTGDTLVKNLSTANTAAKAWKQNQKMNSNRTSVKSQEETVTEDDWELEDWEKEDEDKEARQIATPVLAGLRIPDPVFLCSVEAPTMSQYKVLEEALSNMTKEDPSLRVQVDPDTCQTVLSGMGELHLEVIKQRLLKEYKVEAYMGDIVISYRESIDTPVTESFSLDKTIGGTRHQVNLTMTVLPEEDVQQKLVDVVPNSSTTMEPHRVKRNIRVLRAVTQGAKSALERGPILNFPVLNARLELNDFRCKYGTSTAMIAACASQCVSKALKQSAPRLLQPVMKLEIQTDEDYQQTVISDLNQRSGQLETIQCTKRLRIVHATVPLAEMMGYSSSLRALTSGTASFSMELSHYDLMTEHDTNEAIRKIKGFVPMRTF